MCLKGERSIKQLIGQGLPKWPQMKVTGIPISVQQTMEVIRRTDSFFMSSSYSGNDREFNLALQKVLGIPEEPSYKHFLEGSEEQKAKMAAWHEHHAAMEHWKKSWRIIDTSYVHNEWISCAFIFGPHGWCHPDGNISYEDNVGKHPSIQEIICDWVKIAQAFPFLNVGITLMSGEGSEDYIEPVISFSVFDGKVKIRDPQIFNVHEGHYWVNRDDSFEVIKESFTVSPRYREHKIPLPFLYAYYEKAIELGLVRPNASKVAAFLNV